MADEQTPGRQYYEEQIRFLEERDVEGLMSQYHDDAVLIGFDFQVHGKEALRQHMRQYIQRLGYLKLLSTDKFTETADSIFFEATIETALAVARVYDVFLLRDGRATHQFTGVLSIDTKDFPT